MKTRRRPTSFARYRRRTRTPGRNGRNLWHRAVRILSSYYLGPPPSLAELTERFREEGEEELLETLLTVPYRDLIDRHFVSDEVKAAVSLGATDMGDISAPGSSYIIALYRFSAFRQDTENYGIVRGGNGRDNPVDGKVPPRRRGCRFGRGPRWNVF